MDKYVVYNGKKLRYGYTTGSSATAAAKAATMILTSEINKEIEEISIMLPTLEEIVIKVKIIEKTNKYVIASVIKDGGDDPDITNGIEILAKVSRREDSLINIYGGVGVGKVTKKGLPIEVGKSAINPVPLKMIRDSVLEFVNNTGFDIEIIVPDGVETAKKTLNSKLGIIDGISILGTTGIVKPMSEDAFKDSLAIELKSILTQRESKEIIFTFGNFGKKFAVEKLGRDENKIIIISNFVGFMIDKACEYGVEKIEFIGNIGKFVKVSGGIFHTHSRVSDARLEILSSNALLCGESRVNLLKIMSSNTTEEALNYIEKKEVYLLLSEKAKDKCESHARRNGAELEVSTLIFSNEKGELARSKNF